MSPSSTSNFLFINFPLLLLCGIGLYFIYRNKLKTIKIKEKGPLIHNLGNKGEGLIEENIHGDKIIVKLKGTFGEGLVITDKRLYILKWGYMTGNSFGAKCTSFEYRNIVGMEIGKSWGAGTFQILTPANQETQKSYWGSGRDDAKKSDNIVTFASSNSKFFQEALKIGREYLQNLNSQNIQSNQSTFSYSELEKLAELKDRGIVTKEEFEAKKKKILDL